jgi:hypothetical protein
VRPKIIRNRAFYLVFMSVRDKILVGITIEPALARLRGRDHRMSARARMFAGVLVRRAIATERYPTSLTGSQMEPVTADFDALGTFTPARRLFHRLDCGNVSANLLRHADSFSAAAYDV